MGKVSKRLKRRRELMVEAHRFTPSHIPRNLTLSTSPNIQTSNETSGTVMTSNFGSSQSNALSRYQLVLVGSPRNITPPPSPPITPPSQVFIYTTSPFQIITEKDKDVEVERNCVETISPQQPSTPTQCPRRNTSSARKRLFPNSPAKLFLNSSGENNYKSYSRENNSLATSTEAKQSPVSSNKKAIDQEGRRIVTVHSLTNLLRQVTFHVKKCQSPNLSITDEQRSGYSSDLTISCSTCKRDFKISTDTGKRSLSVNDAAVWAANATAIGYEGLRHAMTIFDIPSPKITTFSSYEEKYSKHLEDAFYQELKKNGQEERRRAIELGQVDGDTAETDVDCDGQWAKRSYNCLGLALSGSAVIIGVLTKKPLFVGIRNKTCFICKRHPGKPHACFKNWTGTSSGMEADIIKEGFEKSIAMHGLRYKRIIADGDASVHAAIKETYLSDPNYFTTVEKIHCYLHAIRSMNRNLLNAQKNSNKNGGYPKPHRDCLQAVIHLFGKYVNYAIDIHIQEKPATNSDTLAEDIKSIPYHIFGNHSKCSEFLCKDGQIQKPLSHNHESSTSQNDSNNPPSSSGGTTSSACQSSTPETFHVKNTTQIKDISDSQIDVDIELEEIAKKSSQHKGTKVPTNFFEGNLWKEILDIMNRLAALSPSLIYKVNTNLAESFQSHVNKYTGGRRTNVILRGGYNRRVHQATFSYSYGPTWYVDVLEAYHVDEPTKLWLSARTMYSKNAERRRNRVSHRTRRIQISATALMPLHFSKTRKPEGDKDYGPNAEKEDVDKTILEQRIESLLKQKRISTAQRQWQVHLDTIGQHSNPVYVQLRANMITASIAGRIMSSQDWRSNANLLDMILNPQDISKMPQISWGIRNESKARALYEKLTGKKVEDSGLFYSLESPGLAATPDGLIGKDGILEIKCPYIERYQLPEIVAERKKTVFLGKDKKTGAIFLRPTSHYHKQVVMQLHVTNRSYCDFVVWTQGALVIDRTTGASSPQNSDGHLLILRIVKDGGTLATWEKMKTKLSRFYIEDLAPEIVDSRFERNMGYRQPPYRQKAIDAAKK